MVKDEHFWAFHNYVIFLKKSAIWVVIYVRMENAFETRVFSISIQRSYGGENGKFGLIFCFENGQTFNVNEELWGFY